MKIQDAIIGTDVDGTLTDTPAFHIDVIDLEETRQIIRNTPVKKGVEILSIMCVKPFAITGRGNYYHDDTLYWLDKNSIPYRKLFTIHGDAYKGMKFNLEEYLKYKVDTYLDNDIEYCLEDDINVIRELEKYGIICSLVEDDFERAFFELFKED